MKTSSRHAYFGFNAVSIFKKNSPVRSANSQFAQVITEGDNASFPKITT